MAAETFYESTNLPRYMKPLYFLFFFISLVSWPAVFASDDSLEDLSARLQEHVYILTSDSMEGRGLGTEGAVHAREYISRFFSSAGLKPYGESYYQHMDLKFRLARVPAVNVVGILPGSDPILKHEYLVLGAHYDHLGYDLADNERTIYPGADDNASGVAMLLELVRYFTENPEATGRSIIFIAFDAEESGLIGSKYFVNNLLIKEEQIKLMMSLDMVGMYHANGGVDLRGIGTLDNGVTIATRLAEQEDIALNRLTSTVSSNTDTRPFGDLGIPAIHVYTNRHSPYHQPEDQWDLLDYQGMAMITLYMQEFVSELARLPQLSPSHNFLARESVSHSRLSAGVVLNTGTNHHRYPDTYFRARNVFALNTGISLQLELTQKYSLYTGVLYDFNGSRSPDGRLQRHSMTIPFGINYYFGQIAGNDAGFYASAGGFFRTHFLGRNADGHLDFQNEHPGEEWGISLGTGMRVKNVHWGFTWRRGLTNLAETSSPAMYSNGRYLTISYWF